VRVVDFEGVGRGMQAVRDIAEGEVVLEVPLETCWTAAAAAESEEMQCVVRNFDKLNISEEDLIALHVLSWRTQSASHHRSDYVRQLPFQYDIPLVWCSNEIDNLSGSTYHGLALREKQRAEDKFSSLENTLQEIGGDCSEFLERHTITLDGYLWGLATVRSRSTELRIEEAQTGEIRELICLPAGGADQFNHSAAIKGECFRLTKEGRLQVVARESYKQGEQVFISYGNSLTTAQLLFTYGFAYDDALRVSKIGTPLENDAVDISHVVPDSCNSKEEAAKHGLVVEAVTMLEDEEHNGWNLQSREDDDAVQVLFHLRLSRPVPNCWLVTNRLLQLEDVQVRELQESSELMAKVLAGRPVSPANEEAALSAMSLELMTRLDGYGARSSELLSRLGGEGESASRRERLAVNLRLIESAILERALDAVQAMIAAPPPEAYVL